MAAKPRCHTDEEEYEDNKKCIIQRKCCLLTIMVSGAFLIVEDEHIFLASNKFLIAAQTDTMIYLEWLSSNLRGNVKLV